mmetsp:Transcript_11893/g.21342  ORF Transcript_11893/g.21342 Transcript_11893/m.21342 type:complete len:119 (-) Transcript_11893:215-571(-)
MPVICIGPVCIPMNVFLPFLVGLLHQYGYLKWFKKEWVTFRFWRNKFTKWFKKDQGAALSTPNGPQPSNSDSTLVCDQKVGASCDLDSSKASGEANVNISPPTFDGNRNDLSDIKKDL